MNDLDRDLAKLKELAYLSMGQGSMTKHWYNGIKAGVEALETKIPQKPFTFVSDEDVTIGRITFKKGVKIHKCQCGHMLRPYDKFCSECSQAQDWSE